MIGLMELSDKAKALEMAAKEKKEDYILDHHEEVIKQYSSVASDIKEQFNVGSAIDDEVLEFAPEDHDDNNGGSEA